MTRRPKLDQVIHELRDLRADLAGLSRTKSSNQTGQTRRHRVSGSPAPWTAAPAELLDEMDRGIVRLIHEARDYLGQPVLSQIAHSHDMTVWAPIPAYTTPTWEATTRTRPPTQLPTLAIAPAARTAWSVTAATLNELSSVNRELAGWMETRIRTWHYRARILTGEITTEWAHLHDAVENPYYIPDPRYRTPGPLCTPPLTRTCPHPSCHTRREERTPTKQIRCPHCDCRSLTEHTITGEIRCTNPGCSTPTGDQPTWPTLNHATNP